MVSTGGGSFGHRRQDSVCLRQRSQRRSLWSRNALRLYAATGGDARSRMESTADATAKEPWSIDAFFFIRKYRFGAQLRGHKRMPRMDWDTFSGQPRGRATRRYLARQLEGSLQCAPTRSDWYLGRQPDLCSLSPTRDQRNFLESSFGSSQHPAGRN